MAQEEDDRGHNHSGASEYMCSVERCTWEEPGVGTHELDKEASQRCPDQVDQEEIAVPQAFCEAARDP